MVVNNRLGYLFVFLGMSMALYAQRKTEVIRYGDLDQWVVRKITEGDKDSLLRWPYGYDYRK